MNFVEYQQYSDATSGFCGLQSTDRLIVASLGLAGETGEVSDTVKKVIGQGHPFNAAKIRDELGDVLWYITEAASALGLNLDALAGSGVAQPDALVNIERVVINALRLSFEAGVICDIMADKIDSPSKNVGIEAFIPEHLTRMFGLLSAVATHSGVTLEEIARHNIDKLAARYPNGFEAARSLARYE